MIGKRLVSVYSPNGYYHTFVDALLVIGKYHPVSVRIFPFSNRHNLIDLRQRS